MVIVMREGASEAQINQATAHLESRGFAVSRITGVNQSILGAVGDKRGLDPREFEVLDGVERVVVITEPYKLASRAVKPRGSTLTVGGVTFGGKASVLMAGPCAVESEDLMEQMAALTARAGGRVLRGGAFKPRTSPYSFQGHGEQGLRWMRQAADRHGLLVVTEVVSAGQVELVAEHADILQIGARNMQNYHLLREAGKSGRAVLLKRGLAATVDEWLMSAEYVLSEGNEHVILCERGIRSFGDHFRFLLDVSAVPAVQERSHLPVVVDPSHAAGVRTKVAPLARAGLAAGADGLIVEVHPQPDHAVSDGPQALLPDQFLSLVEELQRIARAMGRRFADGAPARVMN